MTRRPPRFRRLFRLPWRSAARIRDEVAQEIAFHLEMRTEELMAGGMDPRAARERAEREFGDLEDAARTLQGADERIERGRRRRTWLGDLTQDLAFAGRTLGRRPGFAAAAGLTLALGIGGTTAVFSVVRAVLIDDLPYDRPGQLVRLYQYDIERPDINNYVTAPHFKEYRESAASFQDLATLYTYQETGADLMVGDRPERIRLLEVSAGYFRVLRREPVAGRTFTREEETGEPLAILSERLWRRLGTQRVHLGGKIELDGEPYTVVGRMPQGFEDPLVGRVDVWVPENLQSGGAQYRGNHYLSVIGRLAPGVTPERAREEMAALDRALAEEWPDVADDGGFRLVTLHEDVVASARPALLLLLGAVAFVLLLACVNVANLLMVRSLDRAREMAVRSALGAGRGRITRQLLSESLVLAVAGGLAGVVVAVAGVDALRALGRDAVPRAAEVRLDAWMLGFTAALTLLTGLAFGLVPALRFAGTSPAGTLRESSLASSSGRRYARVRGVLVAGQVAFALMLLVGASVLAASVYRLSRLDLGIRTNAILTFDLNLPGGRYDAPERAELHRRTTDRLARLPGVSGAAAASRLPAIGSYHSWGTDALSGPKAGTEDDWVRGEQRVVEGDYFEGLRIPLLEGRLFDAGDDGDSRPVAVVSRRVANTLFPGMSAIGQRIRMGGVERDIIGVVGDVALDPEGRPAFHVYHAHAQFADNRNWALTYLVAAERDAEALIPAVRREIAAIDPRLVMHRAGTLEDALGRGRSTRRFAFVLVTVFAGLALTLALLGLYGVLSYAVSQRRREIGIRLALGARAGQVAGMILRDGLAVTAAGVVMGIVGALALGRVLSSLVFRTEPTDPVILAGAAAALALAALAAILAPAFRAMRVSPRATLTET